MAANSAQMLVPAANGVRSPRRSRIVSGDVGVVLVGGDLLFREGLKSLFGASSLMVLREYDRMTDIDVATAGQPDPSVAIAVSPEFHSSGFGAWREAIDRVWPLARVVVLVSRMDESQVVDALKAGADGCLFTDMSPEALVQAIVLVAMGENVFPTRIGRSFGRQMTATERPRLTPRERDILRGLLAGLSNKMIANELGTTDMTVKAQLRHLLRKLGVSNRTQAALWAREQGLESEMAH